MKPIDYLSQRLRSGMVQGNMHACLRDTGRLAGGYAETKALGILDLMALAQLAEDLSINKGEGRKKWEEAVAFGRGQPIEWEAAPREDRALDWTDSIGGNGADLTIVDPHWIEDEDIDEPGDDWDPIKDITRYLDTLFDAEDHVGYVTEAWWNEEAGRWLPKRGAFDRTAGQLIQQLSSAVDIGEVFGDSNPETGAWIRFNAVDGQGVKDSNVTKYRFALVECDNVPIPRQYALIRELELPVAVLVHSGKKSIHAIVRVDADTYDEYRQRVDFLYQVCQKNGLAMDRQNRNPSRLSRMPGIMRGERKQWLIDTNIGKSSWGEWKEWIEAVNDELPDIEVVDPVGNEPELAPELITGVLREGHKLLLAGPSKAGKSFALIELAIAFAEGGDWLGWQVKPGRCLYVNLELDSRSARHRFWAIYQAQGRAPTQGMIDVWNLRGNACSLDKLTPKLIRRATKRGYKAVIIDPIYKVLTGDENSAAEMAQFCNWFDRICLALGAATIYCHHHSKGAQGQKSSRDRSSGSGVFARDPDAIIDMIELIIDDSRRQRIIDRWKLDALSPQLDAINPAWRDGLDNPQDDAVVYARVAKLASDFKMPVDWDAVREAGQRGQIASGWRIETTLREFQATKAGLTFFRYPIHVPDEWDLLTDAKAEGEESPQEVFMRKREEVNKQRKKEAAESITQAIDACRGDDGQVSLRDVAEYLNADKDLDDPATWNSVRTGLKTKIGRVGYKVNGDGFVVKKEAKK